MPYDAYVHASTLHTLQQPLSNDPGEMSFLMVSQIMELYFGLTCLELRETPAAAAEDDRSGSALAPLRRAALHLEGLNAAWQGAALDDARPTSTGSATCSARAPASSRRCTGSWSSCSASETASLIRPFRRQAEVYARPARRRCTAPSLWDDVIALLARRGFDLPADLLDRDFAAEHEPHPAVEAAWVRIYGDAGPDNHLRLLGEALTEVAERFGDWRCNAPQGGAAHHGRQGRQRRLRRLAWLQRSMARVVFPELWSARTAM